MKCSENHLVNTRTKEQRPVPDVCMSDRGYKNVQRRHTSQ